MDLLDRRDATLVGAGNVFIIDLDIPARVRNAMHGLKGEEGARGRKTYQSGKLWASPSSGHKLALSTLRC